MYTFTICRTDLQSQSFYESPCLCWITSQCFMHNISVRLQSVPTRTARSLVPYQWLICCWLSDGRSKRHFATPPFYVTHSSPLFVTCKPWPPPRLVLIHDSFSSSSPSLSTVGHSSQLPVTSSWTFITSFYFAACYKIFLSPQQAQTKNYLGGGRGGWPWVHLKFMFDFKTTSTCP